MIKIPERLRPWWDLLQAKLRELAERFPEAGQVGWAFARNPAQGMRTLPDWDWPMLLFMQAVTASACGLLNGITSRQLGAVFFGPILSPISTALGTLLVAGFYYYTFFFWLRRDEDFRRIFTIVVFAGLPVLAIWTITPLFAPLSLVGMAAGSLLLFIGFTDTLGLPKLAIKRLVGGVFLIFALLWLVNTIQINRRHQALEHQATPESLDILEKELKF